MESSPPLTGMLRAGSCPWGICVRCRRYGRLRFQLAVKFRLPSDYLLAAVQSLTITFAADHIDHAEGRHHVGDEESRKYFAQDGQVGEARGTHTALPRPAFPARHEVEAKLAVAALGKRVHLARRNVQTVHDELEVGDHRFDGVVRLALGRQCHPRIVDDDPAPVSYTHLRAHETDSYL